ncbi:hypothetical protein BT63DRAFT_420072 [Microthyrium microscopicum]|uniref:F-box domain-containing protein n=1 Tax=Microthyrium microscopicum TaxID=703497 RepID=A0A6A6UV10_9PEZI|nr:hypothetical protein BT63DRAFT_420072 [Microthyrium microscopicum]
MATPSVNIESEGLADLAIDESSTSPKSKLNITRLPSEILSSIFSYLSRNTLKSINLTCAHLHPYAEAIIWHHLDLVDDCSPRRDLDKYDYRPDVAPEKDLDADSLPGIPLVFGPEAPTSANPRRASRAPFGDVTNGNRGVYPSWDLNPLGPAEVADNERRRRDSRYASLTGSSNVLGMDQHDDTPLIRKLYLLSTRPDLAENVRIVTHRCHLPIPELFSDLVWSCSGRQTLSTDRRTIDLLRLAIANMKNVHTLRFSQPHWNLYKVLMIDFFDRTRCREVPVTRLWLECCSAAWDAAYWPASCDFSQLKSIRLRRSKLVDDASDQYIQLRGAARGRRDYPAFFLSRAGPPVRLKNGMGGMFFTSSHTFQQETLCRPLCDDHPEIESSTIQHHTPTRQHRMPCRTTVAFDDAIYSSVPFVQELLNNQQHELGRLLSYDHRKSGNERQLHPDDGSGKSLVSWISKTFANLTNLTLDWIILRPPTRLNLTTQNWIGEDIRIFADLSKLKFPHLRSFQYRNAISNATMLPREVLLLQPYTVPQKSKLYQQESVDFLSFLENHPKLVSLAWPMDAFLREDLIDIVRPRNEDEHQRLEHSQRVIRVLERLGQMLDTLRVDVYFLNDGEPQTDHRVSNGQQSLRSRRLFIKHVASRMQSVKTMKIEGFVPRDEKRETLWAMAACPLERLITIGRSFPLGNPWGRDCSDLEELEGDAWEGSLADHLQEEKLPDFDTLRSLPMPANVVDGFASSNHLQRVYPGTQDEAVVRVDGPFKASYGWHNRNAAIEPPLLYHVAYHFASTITELKFCGYLGSLVWERPEPSADSIHSDITPSLLHHLKYFHNLQNLVLSYYIMKDNMYDENDIILTWFCDRDRIWQGKEENWVGEQPHPEDYPIQWDDLDSNRVGEYDREALAKLVTDNRFRHNFLLHVAWRRAFVWDRMWSMKTALAPFPRFPDYQLYREQQTQQELQEQTAGPRGFLSHLLIGHPSSVESSAREHWERTSPAEASQSGITTDNMNVSTVDGEEESESRAASDIDSSARTRASRRVEFFETFQDKWGVETQSLSPKVMFAPFLHIHGFEKWFKSAFLDENIVRLHEMVFFWDHMWTSLNALNTKFASRRMAGSLHKQLRPYLSEQALDKGLSVRASFCMGLESSDIFDLEVRMNKEGVKRWTGPRPEIDSGRLHEKIDGRKYF